MCGRKERRSALPSKYSQINHPDKHVNNKRTVTSAKVSSNISSDDNKNGSIKTIMLIMTIMMLMVRTIRIIMIMIITKLVMLIMMIMMKIIF